MRLAAPLFALAAPLFAACTPQPVSPSRDADAAPGPDICEQACKVIQSFSCPEGVGMGGRSCVATCKHDTPGTGHIGMHPEDVTALGHFDLHPECVVEARDVPALRACGVVCQR